MIAAVVAANAGGVRATARLQLGLAGVLAALLLVAVVSALPESRAEHWTPLAALARRPRCAAPLRASTAAPGLPRAVG